MDVLDSGTLNSRDDGMYLLRDTSIAKVAKQKGATELCGISLCEHGFCPVVRRSRSGTASRLVEIWFVHELVCGWRVLSVVRFGKAPAWSQFSCGPALSPEMEHTPARICTFLIPLRTARDHRDHSPVPGAARA